MLHNVCNGLFAFSGIDVGDACEEMRALVELFCEVLHVLEKDAETRFFFGRNALPEWKYP